MFFFAIKWGLLRICSSGCLDFISYVLFFFYLLWSRFCPAFHY